MSEFKIDFFELCFLAETCIPPRPIARSMFWDKLINEYYNQLSDEESDKLFEWICKNNCFDLNNEDCKLFYDRFNPDNQYQVKTLYEGKDGLNDCFLHKGKYHISKTQSIYEKYIVSITKKINNNDTTYL